MRKVWLVLFLAALLVCAGCSGTAENISEEQEQAAEKTIEVTIPETYLNFTSQDAEDLAESYQAYCRDVRVDEPNLVIEMTELQRKKLMEMNDAYRDEVIKRFAAVDENYKCEIGQDYRSIVYEYDEKLYEKDAKENTHIQGELLMGVISACVMNQILETDNSDWEITVTVKNCHTGKVVGETVLPEGEFFIDADEWEESYR